MALRVSVSIAVIAGLAACAQPVENSLSRSDLSAFSADDRRATSLSFTPADEIPTGSASYEGHVRSAAIVNGQADYDVAGLLELNINISDTATRQGSGEITGRITELNLFDDNDDGFDDQQFDGDLSIAGRVNEGRIEADATGVLGAVLANVFTEQTSTWDIALDGDLRDDLGRADVATGAISGGTAGAATDEYDVRLTGGGRFYAERN